MDFLRKYDYKTACKHERHKNMIIIKATRTKRSGQTHHLDLPVYMTGTQTAALRSHQQFIVLKGPTSKQHYANWWNYVNNFCAVSLPIPLEDCNIILESLEWAAENNRRCRIFPKQQQAVAHVDQPTKQRLLRVSPFHTFRS